MTPEQYAPVRRDGHHPQITCNHKRGEAHACPVPHNVWLATGQPANQGESRT